jgi:hypothetical protein
MTTPASFRKADVTRLVRALEAAGKSVTSVKIDPLGNVVANCGGPGATAGEDGPNPWDEVLSHDQEERPAAERH